MYKALLSDYDTRQRELLLENAELNKVLQQMKKDMVSILSSKKPILKGDKYQDDGAQVGSKMSQSEFDYRVINQIFILCSINVFLSHLQIICSCVNLP